jgi:hypothetical protein
MQRMQCRKPTSTTAFRGGNNQGKVHLLSPSTRPDPLAYQNVLDDIKAGHDQFMLVEPLPASEMTEDNIRQNCILDGVPMLFDNVITDKWDMDILSWKFLRDKYGKQMLEATPRDNEAGIDLDGWTMERYLKYWIGYDDA